MSEATAARSAAFAPPSLKQQFLDTFVREHATTIKVLRALPPDQSEFRPHARSQSARELAYTFVIEQLLITAALNDQLQLGGKRTPPPEDFTAIVDQFDRDFEALAALIRRTPDEQFFTPVQFFTGPGQLGDMPKLQFAWFMLCDQIHHRGQFSVYVRMAGGKVPSIYGPSGDEPWR
jgi:uncharacterized damage-inducible protein DinB